MQSRHVSAPATAQLIGLRTPALVLLGLTLAAAALYFPYRLFTFNPAALPLSIAVYLAEVFGLFSLALHLFMTSQIVTRKAPAPLDNVTVDLFVTTYNEPVSMLRRTLAAAKQVRRASRVVLLDDGNRAEMKKLAEEMGVVYLARENNMHAKAGNLNFGLEHSSADFVATFDADHAPAPDFLEQTLGYFRNEHVAIVQTPQDFYNLDSFQHRRVGHTNQFWTEQSLFFRVIQPGKDRWNAAFYCGSCAVLRRWSLNRIGGFATGTITEDLHTSIKLHKAGFESVYHNVTLAYGIAPASLEPYETQRVRWGQGAMQVWRKEGVLFARGLTLPQRLCYLASIVTYFDAWQKLLFYVLPPLVLITAIMPVANVNLEFMVRFTTWFVLSLVLGEELGRGYARTWIIEQYNFLRMPAFLRASLALFFPAKNEFKVTPKTSMTSKTSKTSKSAGGKFRFMTLLPLFCFAAIPFSIWRFASGASLPVWALVINIMWSVLLGVVMIQALRFAGKHKRERRTDYRFTAPLPFDVHLPSGGWGTLRALDMTSDGVRLAAPMGLDFSVGRKIDAVLRLPDGPATVTLRIRHREVMIDDPLPQRLEIGAAITWKSADDQDRLSAMLYGAGLEQHLLDLTDQGAAPLDRFANDNVAIVAREIRRAWVPGAVDGGERRFDIAAQPLDLAFNTWRVLSYQKLPDDARLTLPARSGSAESAAEVRVMDARIVPAGASFVHISEVELKARKPTARAESKGGGDAWLLAGAASALLAIGCVSSIAVARAQTLVIAGAEGGAKSNYAYAGVVVPVGEQDDRGGWAVRASADRLGYSYDKGVQQIDARAYGGSVAVVRQFHGAWGWADASVGVRTRDTHLSPNDASNPAHGRHTDAEVETQGRVHAGGGTDVTWLAAHTIDQRDTMARAGVDHGVGGARLGIDLTRFSGPRYGENQAGVTAQFQPSSNVTLDARAGAARNDDGKSGGYAGLGLAISLR